MEVNFFDFISSHRSMQVKNSLNGFKDLLVIDFSHHGILVALFLLNQNLQFVSSIFFTLWLDQDWFPFKVMMDKILVEIYSRIAQTNSDNLSSPF